MTGPVCDVAGYAAEGGLWLDAPCDKPATHRYRPKDNPEAPWKYRCASCAKWSMFAPEVVVEEIGEAP